MYQKAYIDLEAFTYFKGKVSITLLIEEIKSILKYLKRKLQIKGIYQ